MASDLFRKAFGELHSIMGVKGVSRVKPFGTAAARNELGRLPFACVPFFSAVLCIWNMSAALSTLPLSSLGQLIFQSLTQMPSTFLGHSF